jgi:hypothetical protein
MPVLQSSSGIAVFAPGYWQPVAPTVVTAAVKAFGTPVQVSTTEYEQIRQLCVNGISSDKAAITALPSQIPLTVQGASEDFITSTMGQVVANTNQNATQLNGSIFAARDQVKVHVTNEANRVIAAG